MKNLEKFKIEILTNNDLSNINGGTYIPSLPLGGFMASLEAEFVEGVTTFVKGFIGGFIDGFIDHSKIIK